jgi:hypothetical protein
MDSAEPLPDLSLLPRQVRHEGEVERRILRDQTGPLRVNSGNQSVSASPLKSGHAQIQHQCLQSANNGHGPHLYRSGMESSGRGPRWYLRSFAEIVRSLILAIRRCLDVGIEFPVFLAVMPITRSAQHQQHGLVLRPPNYVTLPRSGGRIGNVRHSLGY